MVADAERPHAILVLTGAGVSADSGVATFRGPDGLWEGHRVEDVATPEAFARNPALVQRFYDERRAALARVEPNAAHRALARLDAEWPGELLIVTQNVDDLHERGGARQLLHTHGELTRAWGLGCRGRSRGGGSGRRLQRPGGLRRGWCLGCGGRFRWEGSMGTGAACPSCGEVGQVRPDIVWFGEMPYEMERIDH